jgi:hypothetical protein
MLFCAPTEYKLCDFFFGCCHGQRCVTLCDAPLSVPLPESDGRTEWRGGVGAGEERGGLENVEEKHTAGLCMEPGCRRTHSLSHSLSSFLSQFFFLHTHTLSLSRSSLVFYTLTFALSLLTGCTREASWGLDTHVSSSSYDTHVSSSSLQDAPGRRHGACPASAQGEGVVKRV